MKQLIERFIGAEPGTLTVDWPYLVLSFLILTAIIYGVLWIGLASEVRWGSIVALTLTFALGFLVGVSWKRRQHIREMSIVRDEFLRHLRGSDPGGTD